MLSPHALFRFVVVLLTVLVVFVAVRGYAQAPAKKWYVGRSAGIDFTRTPARALVDGNPLFVPGEGGASMADDAGNLLFYTDGVQIYDRLHTLMPNSIGLGGHVSSTQSALIVKKPGSATLYYVFTSDAAESYPSTHKGVRYSVVDMSLRSGRGDVAAGQKSMPLASLTTEKLTAVNSADGQSVWIITHAYQSADFYAWPLSASGLGQKVTSTAGAAHGTVGTYDRSVAGCMKASPDGRYLATAMLWPVGGRAIAELFNFNAASGQVTLNTSLSENVSDPASYNFYGVEFSRSGGKLYISSRKGPYQIFQYDLCSQNILGSKTAVGSSVKEFGTLQLAPDGKIYCAKNSDQYLGTITDPEAGGTACTYRDQGFNLTGRTSTYGLNNLNQSLFYKPRLTVTAQSACFGQPTQFSVAQTSCGAASNVQFGYAWQFGDAASGANNTGAGASPSHIYTVGGAKRVILTYSWAGQSDTTSVAVQAPSQHHLTLLGGDTTHCPGHRSWHAVVDGTTTPTSWGFYTTAANRWSGTLNHDSLICNCTDGEYLVGKVHGTAPDGCPTDSVPLNIVIHTQKLITPTGPAQTCLTDASIALQATQAGPAYYRWLLDADTLPASATLERTGLAAGSHTVAIVPNRDQMHTRGVCLSTSAPLTVSLLKPQPLAFEVADSGFCKDNPIGKYALVAPADSVIWHVTGGQLQSAEGQSQRAATVNWTAIAPYALSATAVTVSGCPAQHIVLTVQERCLDVKNIITQNADHKNDVFTVENIEAYPDNSLKIYNRWGKCILDATGYKNDQSVALATGTHFYELRVKTGSGDKVFKGWVEVLE